MSQTLEQKIAEAQAKLARLRNQERQLENGQKIIAGGMFINLAKKDPKIRQLFVETAEKTVTREADKKRLEPLLKELREIKHTEPPKQGDDV